MFVVSFKPGTRSEERGARSIRNSALHIPHSTLRLGLSLTEVLIAMGILTVGLLSVAAIFPVGSFYMQKADIADRGSAIAQSVMNDLATRGMLNPRTWYVMTPLPLLDSKTSQTSVAWNKQFTPDSWLLGAARNATFTRPFAASLNEGLNQSAAASDKTILAAQFGNAYVIDPIGASVMTFRNAQLPSQPAYNTPAGIFPSAAYTDFFQYAKYPSTATTSWLPWAPASSSASSSPPPLTWPIRRVTFRQSSTGLPMDSQVAESYFRGSDDLAYDLPSRDDRPAMQRVDVSNNTVLSRQWTGDYSWIVTVSPTTNAARDALASNPEGYAYDVSVVVFYKRVLPDTEESAWLQFGGGPRNSSAMGLNERVVKATVQSSGLNGGELLLTDWADLIDANNNKVSAFDQLRTGQWIMLCGPHPNSSVSEPRLALNWYQVLAVDTPVTGMIGYDSTKSQKVVSLRGPQWPWQPPTSYNSPEASNNLCVGIFRGAVAVHSKTMCLEGFGSPFSVAGASAGGDGSFGNTGNPGTTPPSNTFH